MSFPPATEMFQFAGFASILADRYRSRGGLPHSEIFGSQGAPPSPKLIAGCHVLHRLSVPRHPPNALLIRSRTLIRSPCAGTQMSEDREQMSDRRHQFLSCSDLVCAMPRESAHANTHTVVGAGIRRQEPGDRKQRASRTSGPRSPPGHRRPFDRPTIEPRPRPKEKTGASPVAETLFTFPRTGDRGQDPGARNQVPGLRVRPTSPKQPKPMTCDQRSSPPSWLLAPEWWSRSESNRRPPECKSGALPTELRPRSG